MPRLLSAQAAPSPHSHIISTRSRHPPAPAPSPGGVSVVAPRHDCVPLWRGIFNVGCLLLRTNALGRGAQELTPFSSEFNGVAPGHRQSAGWSIWLLLHQGSGEDMKVPTFHRNTLWKVLLLTCYAHPGRELNRPTEYLRTRQDLRAMSFSRCASISQACSTIPGTNSATSMSSCSAPAI